MNLFERIAKYNENHDERGRFASGSGGGGGQERTGRQGKGRTLMASAAKQGRADMARTWLRDQKKGTLEGARQEIIRRFGLTDKEAADVMSQHGEERARAATAPKAEAAKPNPFPEGPPEGYKDWKRGGGLRAATRGSRLRRQFGVGKAMSAFEWVAKRLGLNAGGIPGFGGGRKKKSPLPPGKRLPLGPRDMPPISGQPPKPPPGGLAWPRHFGPGNVPPISGQPPRPIPPGLAWPGRH